LAANANIGAARAAYFPRISLTAAIGSASSELSGLFKSGSGYWSYAPQLVMPIFDMRTWSSHSASKVRKEMMISEYEKSIQSAFREVADVLATLGTVDQQLKAQQDYVASVKRTYELANYRYEGQIDNYLSLLDAQRALQSSEQALVALEREKFASQIDLYTVLGGGWEDSPAEVEETAQTAENAPAEAAE
jgi:multidrug efflux system outer membrane protein